MAGPITSKVLNFPRVFPSTEMLAKATRKALSVEQDFKILNPRNRFRKFVAEKLSVFSAELTRPLGTVIEGFSRTTSRLPPFESVVVDLTIRHRELAGFGSLPETLDSVKRLRKLTTQIAKTAIQAAANAETRSFAEQTLESTMKDIEGLWKAQGWVLELLLDMGQELKSIPLLENLPTVVLVGSPNVGKSSIVRAISTGTPEVNDYPFTTRGMTLGHVLDKTGQRICQVMDTPGLLPRADDQRNEMERLTLASMEHLPSLVVFVMDLSGSSGVKSSIDAQAQVREEIWRRFGGGGREWIDVVSKADLNPDPRAAELCLPPPAALLVSSTEATGLDQLRHLIMGSRTVRMAAKLQADEEDI